MKTITIELPNCFEISGMKDAPEYLKTVKTDNFTAEFCLNAIEAGLSKRVNNAWSTSKKDLETTKTVHSLVESGEWNRRERGISGAKFDKAIKELNVAALIGKLTREQLLELACKISPDGEVQF